MEEPHSNLNNFYACEVVIISLRHYRLHCENLLVPHKALAMTMRSSLHVRRIGMSQYFWLIILTLTIQVCQL